MQKQVTYQLRKYRPPGPERPRLSADELKQQRQQRDFEERMRRIRESMAELAARVGIESVEDLKHDDEQRST